MKLGKLEYKKNTANRLHELYCSEEGMAQFAVDYILARNKELSAPAAIRAGVLEVGNACVQESAKQIAERLVIEKEEAEKEAAKKKKKSASKNKKSEGKSKEGEEFEQIEMD